MFGDCFFWMFVEEMRKSVSRGDSQRFHEVWVESLSVSIRCIGRRVALLHSRKNKSTCMFSSLAG